MRIINQYRNFRYFKEPSPYAERLLNISDGMAYTCIPSFLIDRNYFKNNLIMFVLRGTLYVEQFGKKHTLSKSQGILMELTKKHKYYFDKTCETHIIWFHFRGEPCQKIIDELDKGEQLPLVFNSTWLENRIYDLFDATLKENYEQEFFISSIIYSIIIDLSKEAIVEMQSVNNEHNRFKNDVDNYISMNICSKLSLDAMSKHFKMSKYHFCRRFKEQLGSTPFEYIKVKKIEVAKKMLAHTNESVADIAGYLGFCDQGYFTNVFKSVVGCTPKEFAKLDSF